VKQNNAFFGAFSELQRHLLFYHGWATKAQSNKERIAAKNPKNAFSFGCCHTSFTSFKPVSKSYRTLQVAPDMLQASSNIMQLHSAFGSFK
jgi:hypothetical protein